MPVNSHSEEIEARKLLVCSEGENEFYPPSLNSDGVCDFIVVSNEKKNQPKFVSISYSSSEMFEAQKRMFFNSP